MVRRKHQMIGQHMETLSSRPKTDLHLVGNWYKEKKNHVCSFNILHYPAMVKNALKHYFLM